VSAPRRRWPWLLAGGVALAVGLVALAELRGWAFLGPPAQRWLSTRLDRPVQLTDADGHGFSMTLWGGIQLSIDHLRVANATWATTTDPMLAADQLQLSLRWADLLTWRPGQRLPLQTLSAQRLDLQLQRLANGQANWQLAATDTARAAPTPPRRPADVLSVQRLAVDAGRVRWQDAVLGLQLDGQFSQRAASIQQAGALQAQASGQYRGKPVQATLQAGSPSGWLADAQALDSAVPLTLTVQAGRANLAFGGEVRHLLGTPDVTGRYRISGPSLAAVGEPLGITLPQTRRFDMAGRLVQTGHRWFTVVEQATVGDSRLGGAFQYDQPPGQRPLLQGRLTGSRLLLQDLGPALGGASGTDAKPVRSSGRVLPDRQFSLPALRAMDANVLVDLDQLDFGTSQLRPAAPLRGHIRLADGVLRIDQLQATLAQGVLSGQLLLDGRQATARWDLNLTGRQLTIEQALPATRRAGQAPYASGRLDGNLTLNGRGNSTADLLASADGQLRVHWRQGRISHLLVEAAGLDIAQGLGVLLRGDDPLPVNCGAADLRIKDGRVTPQVLLVDTRDSLLWVQGSVSLATEQLQLQAQVRPKDWSPLTLRTPLHIDGTLGRPVLSLDKPELLKRAVPAALLALLHPLAALLPLIDAGDDHGPAVAGCQAVVRRFQLSGPSAAGH